MDQQDRPEGGLFMNGNDGFSSTTIVAWSPISLDSTRMEAGNIPLEVFCRLGWLSPRAS